MYRIYVDDVRLTPDSTYDKHCYTTNETLNCVRKQYKAGVRDFLLDLDHDCGDNYVDDGGDYINILKTLEDLQYSGKLKNCKVYVKLHSMNVVGKQNMKNIIENSKYFIEVR